MKLFKTLLLVAFASMAAYAADHHVGTNDHAQVSYIGFNTLKSARKGQNVEKFLQYVATIKPIMEAHGQTLDVYSVDHNSDPSMPVDFITFGTAKDQQSFQAFFANSEFQAAFPTLVGIIEQHFVTFLDKPVVPQRTDSGYTQLSLDWLKAVEGNTYEEMRKLDHQLMELGAGKGATKTHQAAGVIASTGLTDDLAPATAPSIVSVWRMEDPHAFLEDDTVTALNKKMAQYSETFRSYWISRVENPS